MDLLCWQLRKNSTVLTSFCIQQVNVRHEATVGRERSENGGEFLKIISENSINCSYENNHINCNIAASNTVYTINFSNFHPILTPPFSTWGTFKPVYTVGMKWFGFLMVLDKMAAKMVLA